MARQRPVDALAAAQLAGALRRNKVYLLSRLDPSLVEDLDVVPIASADELRRLAGHHASCLLIPNAPRVSGGEEQRIGQPFSRIQKTAGTPSF